MNDIWKPLNYNDFLDNEDLKNRTNCLLQLWSHGLTSTQFVCEQLGISQEDVLERASPLNTTNQIENSGGISIQINGEDHWIPYYE